MNQRFRFKKSKENKWYLIDIDKEELFVELEEADPILLADEFDQYEIDNIEDFTFEFPIELKYE